MTRLPGGEIIGQTIDVSDEDLARGAELLEAMSSGGRRAHVALSEVALNNGDHYSIESAKQAVVLIIPRPNFELARIIKNYPTGPTDQEIQVESSQPINTRVIYTPGKQKPTWRATSLVEPYPDYRYQWAHIGLPNDQDPIYTGLDIAVIPLQTPEA